MSAQPSNCVTSLSAALDHLHSAKLILKSEATSKITSDNSVTPHNVHTEVSFYQERKKYGGWNVPIAFCGSICGVLKK